MKDKRKYLFMLVLLLLILFLTFKTIFDKNNIKVVIDNLKNINIDYIFICLFLIFGYFYLQGIYMKIVLKSLNQKITLKKGIFYSMIEFYFSGITPSSAGGQPVQLYHMTKDKIPLRKSYITLMLNTIFFKLIIIILGLIILIFNNKYIFNSSILYIIFFILGLVVDLIIVVGGLLLLFKPKYIKKILVFLINIGKKIKVFRKRLENINLEELLNRYKNELIYIKNNKSIVIISFIITFIQRMLLFSIAYFIYKSLGFNKYNYFDLLTIQLSVQIAIEAMPLPGGTGFSEKMMHDIYNSLFSITYADIGMLLTRTFSFYIPLLISGIVILLNSIIKKKNT